MSSRSLLVLCRRGSIKLAPTQEARLRHVDAGNLSLTIYCHMLHYSYRLRHNTAEENEIKKLEASEKE